MSQVIRTYSRLCQIYDFRERFEYLRLDSRVGEATFGYDKYLNQRFYSSAQWRDVRSIVIARDRGLDLGFEEYEIFDRVDVHHMNPMTVGNLLHGDPEVLDPEFLITVSHRTHNAIHFGDERLLAAPLVTRRPGDTKLW